MTDSSPERRRTVAVVAGAALLLGILTAAIIVEWGPLVGVALFSCIFLIALGIYLKRDPVTLLTVFVILLFSLPAQFIIGPLGATGTPALMVGLACAWWWVHAKFLRSSGLRLGSQPIRVALIFFIWCMGAGYAVAQTRPLNGAEATGATRAVITVLALAGIGLLTADGVISRPRLDVLLLRVIAATSVMAVVGMVQFFTPFDPVDSIRLPGLSINGEIDVLSQRSTFRRVAGTAGHPIEFGVVLSIVFPIALHYAMTSEGRRKTRCWLGAGLLAVALPLSISRSAVLGLLTGMLVVFPTWSWKRRLNASFIAVLFMIFMRSAIPGLLGTFKSLFLNAGSDPSVTGRTDDFSTVNDLVSSSPWFGRGLGTFLPSEYFFLDNQYLASLIETGVVGLVALVILLLVGVSTARGARHRSTDHCTRSLGQSLAASLVAAGATFFTFDALAFDINAGLVFLLLGCSGALWRSTRGDDDTIFDRPAAGTRTTVARTRPSGDSLPVANRRVSPRAAG